MAIVCHALDQARRQPPQVGTFGAWQVPGQRDTSIRWGPTQSLRLRRFYPPTEIVGKGWERTFECLAALANGLAFGRYGLSDRTNSNRAGDHDHSHLGEYAVPGGCRPRTREAAGRIARNRGGPPKPLLQEIIGEVLQSRLNAPIVLAGDEHEAVGVADLAGEPAK